MTEAPWPPKQQKRLVPFRMGETALAKIDKIAYDTRSSRSQVLRFAIVRALRDETGLRKELEDQF